MSDNLNVKMTLDGFLAMKNKIQRLQDKLRNCRNELCLKCGRYKEAHCGACDDCRYRHGGEWEADIND